MAQLTSEQIQDLKENMAQFARNHIDKYPEDVFKISSELAIYTIDILTALNDKNADFNRIADIYSVVRTLKEEYDKAAEKTTGLENPEEKVIAETEPTSSTEVGPQTTPQNRIDSIDEPAMNEEIATMMEDIKDHIKFHPTDIFKIAEITGMTPQKIVEIINSPSKDFSQIEAIYVAIKEKNINAEENMSQKVSKK